MRKLIAAEALLSISTTSAGLAQDGPLPLGGQPPPGATAALKDLTTRSNINARSRPCSGKCPAVAIYSYCRAACNDLGAMERELSART
jgi:hypothetical protein